MSESKIDPQKALTFIAKTASEFAQAKANRIYCDEYRKSLKALEMKRALQDGVADAVGAQEREAYSSPVYIAHLQALREAIEAEEVLRWKLVAAEASIEVWRSQEASNRMMDRGAQ